MGVQNSAEKEGGDCEGGGVVIVRGCGRVGGVIVCVSEWKGGKEMNYRARQGIDKLLYIYIYIYIYI